MSNDLLVAFLDVKRVWLRHKKSMDRLVKEFTTVLQDEFPDVTVDTVVKLLEEENGTEN
jgi:hypothetical protein